MFSTVDVDIISVTSMFSVFMTQPVLEVDFAHMSTALAEEISGRYGMK